MLGVFVNEGLEEADLLRVSKLFKSVPELLSFLSLKEFSLFPAVDSLDYVEVFLLQVPKAVFLKNHFPHFL